MGERRQFRPDSDELDRALLGYVLANRINDMAARRNTKRSSDYLEVVRFGFQGQQAYEESDEYRMRAKAMTPAALDAYEESTGASLDRNLVYFHDNPDIKIAAQPDAMEGDLLGITVHWRRSLRTFEQAIERGISPSLYRQAQALMHITGAQLWLHLNYWEAPDRAQRKLADLTVTYNPQEGAHLEEIMLAFLLRSRRLQ